LLVLFRGAERLDCVKQMDAIDDGTVDVSDVVFILDVLSEGAHEASSPALGTCRTDETPDDLPCPSEHSCS